MTTPQHVAAAHVLAQKVSVVHVDRIHPHPANIREELGDLAELASSIRNQGILQPLVVQPHPEREGEYRLLAGHRRLEAARLAGLEAVPVIVRHGVTDEGALELMLVENCQRRELNSMERAEALGALVNRGYTHAEIAKRTGKSTAWVGYYLALLDLDEGSQEKVRGGELAVTHAVNGVRKARKAARKKRGSTADFTWEPDHLAASHPLAKRARTMCDTREHGMRRRLGGTACGQCWETVIRIDERKVIEAEERM